MKNQRIIQKPTYDSQYDWVVVEPEEADFAFRCWGGTYESCLTVHTDLTIPLSLSRASFMYIKSLMPYVKEVFESFNKDRMLKTRTGSFTNPGGNIFAYKDIVVEYLITKEELDIDDEGREPEKIMLERFF